MLILHPSLLSGPDFLLVCGCKGTTFPDTFPQNTPIEDKPKYVFGNITDTYKDGGTIYK